MRARNIRLALAGTVCALVAGCGSASAPGADAEGEEGGQGEGSSTTLEIAGIEHPYMEAMVDEFRERHPDIEVEYTPGELSFEEGRIQTMLRSGEAPDVMLVNSGPGRVGVLADAGLIADLSDLYEQGGLSDRYQTAVVEQITRQGDGSVYEVVEGMDIFQVYYNKDLFAQAGVDVPTSFDDLLALCAPLSESGVLPMVAGVRDNYAGGWLLGTLVQASTGEDVMEDVIYGDGRFDQEAIVRGGEMLRALLEQGCIDGGQAAALDNEQAQAAFLNGSAAMIVMPQGPLAELRAEGGDVSPFAAFPMPTPDSGIAALPTAGLAHSWVMAAETDAQSAAREWLQWVSSEDYLQAVAEEGMTLAPALVVPESVTLDPSIQDAVDKIADGAGYNPSVYVSAAAKDAWYQAVQGLITGSMSAQEAMANVQVALEENRPEAGETAASGS